MINYLATWIKKPLIACKDILRKFQEEPQSSVYIVVVAALMILAERLFLKFFLGRDNAFKLPELLEVFAIILILIGTIWTAFGVVLSPKQKDNLKNISLDDYIMFIVAPKLNQVSPINPMDELVATFIVASSFASSGLFLTTLGSLIILLKMLLF